MSRWIVRLSVISPHPALCAGWARFQSWPEAFSADVLSASDQRPRFGIFDQGHDVHGWVIADLEADDQASAEALGRALFGDLLDGAPPRVRSDPPPTLTMSCEPAALWPADEYEQQARVPSAYDWTTRPVPLSGMVSGSDSRDMVVTWTSGSAKVSRIDVQETDLDVTITVHEERPPLIDREGNEWGLTRMMLQRCATLSLRTGPLADRVVVDGSTSIRLEAAVIDRADCEPCEIRYLEATQ